VTTRLDDGRLLILEILGTGVGRAIAHPLVVRSSVWAPRTQGKVLAAVTDPGSLRAGRCLGQSTPRAIGVDEA
jgi:hypothetical protein